MPRRSSSFASRWRAVGHGVLARPADVAHRLLVGSRGMHDRQQVRAQQLRQLAHVAAVGLHAVPGPPGDQRRRDHPAFDARGLELALQREAARTGLVARYHRTCCRTLQALREPLHRPRLVRQLPFLGPLGPRARGDGRRWGTGGVSGTASARTASVHYPATTGGAYADAAITPFPRVAGNLTATGYGRSSPSIVLVLPIDWL